jgi:hypothetical protein
MPKVGKEFVSFATLHYEFDVHFTKKTGFYVKLENNLATISHNGIISSTVYDDVVRIVKQKVKEYWESTITPPKKVIVYKIKRILPQGAVAYHPGFNEISFASGSGITVHYGIRYTSEVDGKLSITPTSRFISYKQTQMFDFKSSEYSSHQVIDWDEKKEAFFKTLTERINELIMNVSDFFGKDSTHLLANIDKNTLKLLE